MFPVWSEYPNNSRPDIATGNKIMKPIHPRDVFLSEKLQRAGFRPISSLYHCVCLQDALLKHLMPSVVLLRKQRCGFPVILVTAPVFG